MNLNRRDFLKSTASAMPALSFTTYAAKTSRRPNIVIIICDQMCLDAISAYQSVFKDKAHLCHWLNTPNLDRMIAGGTSFVESHTTDPVCCPARAALFTGRMPCENAVIHNNIGIDRTVTNLGQWMETHGYRNIYCGKWHAGGAWDFPTVDGSRKIPGFETLPVASAGNGKVLDYEVSTSVSSFLYNYNDSKPFMIVAGMLNPHDQCFWTPGLGRGLITADVDNYKLGDRLPVLPPNQDLSFSDDGIIAGGLRVPPEKWGDMHWKNYIYDYLRQVETVDRDVGRILDAVDARQDTVVLFTSDHGDNCGRHRGVQKGTPYEESIKVPLLFYGPGIKAGQIDTAHLISHVDIMPTLCDFAGINPPENVRGMSLRPLLEGRPDAEWRDEVYYAFNKTGRAIRSTRYKYVMRYKYSGDSAPTGSNGEFPEKPFVDKATGQPAKFEKGMGDRYEKESIELLFDMVSDPWETTNLVGDSKYKTVLAEHRSRLKTWEAKLETGTRFDRN